MTVRVGTVPNPDVFSKLMAGGWYKHPKLEKLGRAVLARDKHVCQGCGFSSVAESSSPYGYLIPASLAHPGFLPVDVSRSKTYCPMCLSSMAVNWSVAPGMVDGIKTAAPGLLIAFDELSQAEINRLAISVVGLLGSRTVGSNSQEIAAASSLNNAMKARQSNLALSISAYRVDMDAEFANALALLPP